MSEKRILANRWTEQSRGQNRKMKEGRIVRRCEVCGRRNCLGQGWRDGKPIEY